MATNGRRFVNGSIESATGQAGAHSDDPPSKAPATIPGAKHQTGKHARALSFLEGAAMPPFLKIKNSAEIRLAPVLEVRARDADAGVIEGYASVFGGPPDSYGDIIAPGAFKRTLAEHKSEGSTPAMLWCHKGDEPVGRWLELREDATGLFARGKLNLDTQAGRETHAHVKGGDVSGFSIGFVLPEGGRTRNSEGSWTITDLDLWEISVTPIPANRRARVNAVKSLQSKSELIDMLREGGLPKAAAARVAAGGWPALAGQDHQKAIDLAERIRLATANLRTSK